MIPVGGRALHSDMPFAVLYAEAIFNILAYLRVSTIFKMNEREKETAEETARVGC